MRSIILIAHNLRSAHNVGSLLRTAEGLGVTKVYLTGYTPYPFSTPDKRLPHIAKKVNNQIAKTALGAELSLKWKHYDSAQTLINKLKRQHYVICALEQTPNSILLPAFESTDKLALIVGREIEGIEPEILKLTDIQLEIPMFGKKESFNVAQATAMALYHLTFAI